MLVRAAVGGDGGGGVCEHHLNESTRNDEPETMQRERKKMRPSTACKPLEIEIATVTLHFSVVQ